MFLHKKFQKEPEIRINALACVVSESSGEDKIRGQEKSTQYCFEVIVL